MKTYATISAALLLVALLGSCHKEQQKQQIIPLPPGYHTSVSVLAGSGSSGSNDGAGTSAAFSFAWAIAMDASGNFYVTDNARIRKITPQGVVSTLDDNPNASGSMVFANAEGLVIDAAGNFYVSYSSNNCIRKISPDGKSGVIFAGSHAGEAGDVDGSGTDARFSQPAGLAIDPSGNIYVADSNNDKIRKITPAGAVTTFAGTGISTLTDGPAAQAAFYEPNGVTLDQSGNMYVADGYNYGVRKITPDGTVSTVASGGIEPGSSQNLPLFDVPTGIAVADDGTLYVSNIADALVKRILPTGAISTVGSDIGYYGFYEPTGMVIDKTGTLYIVNTGTNQVLKVVPQANKYL